MGDRLDIDMKEELTPPSEANGKDKDKTEVDEYAGLSDTQKQLKEVRTAISAILSGGQSYKIGSRSLTRADLTRLFEMQNQLETQVAQEESTVIGRRAAAVFFDRR